FDPAAEGDASSAILVLEPRYRGIPRLVVALVGMGHLWALGGIGPERAAGFDALGDQLREFVERQRIRHRLSAFERRFHCAGELVVRAGARADAAFVVVDGRATGTAGGRVVAEYAPGDSF